MGQEQDSHLDANNHHDSVTCIAIDSARPRRTKISSRPLPAPGIERERVGDTDDGL